MYPTLTRKRTYFLTGLFALVGIITSNAQVALNFYPEADNQVGFHDNFNTANTNGANTDYFGTFMQPGVSGGNNGGRGMIYFDLSSIPTNANVISATLSLTGRGPLGTGAALSVGNIGDNVSYLQRVVAPWDEFTVTWNTQPPTTALNQITVGPSTQIDEDMTIDVTDFVAFQVAQPDSAFGWKLRLVTEAATRGLFFWSSNTSDTSVWPVLTVVVDCVPFQPEITADASACGGSILNAGAGYAAYDWSNGSTSQLISVNGEGAYSVTVTDNNGCTGTNSYTVQNSTTLTLPAAADAIFAFHDGYATAGNNYGTAGHNAATSQPSAAGSGLNTARSVISFDLASIPPGSTVLSAHLNLYGSGPTDAGGAATSVGNTGDNVTYFQRVTSSWAENTITWNNQPTTTTSNQVSVGPIAAVSQDLNIDVTQLVLDMLANPANSFGFEMRLATESPTRNLSFRSSEYADVTKRPTLTIVIGSAAASPVTASIAIDSSNCNLTYVALTANGTGGTEPYQYNWSNGATTQSIVGEGPVFSVTVIDANGCAASDTVYLLPTPPVFTQITGDLTVCPGATTELTASPDGMTAYLWSNGAASQSINVGAGSYSVTVFAGECPAGSAEVTVTTNPLPTLSTSVTNASGGSNNGAIDLTVSGGGAPFTYVWSNGSTTQDINGLTAGTYTVTVTTADGCTASTNATVTQATGCGLTVNVNGTNLTCYGAKNGSATAVATGAAGPFTYVWSNGKTTQTVIKLTAGTYNVTVTAANGCTASGTVTVIQPSSIAAYITCVKVCPGACNGAATVTIFSGGIAPFTYAWSNGQTTATANGLCAGIYWVTITDANGCKKIVGTAVTTSTVGCNVISRMDYNASFDAMTVYPNPAEQMVNVVMPAFEGTGTLRVVNALGQTVALMNVSATTVSLDVSQWAAGIYHVQFESNGLVEAAKFVKH